MEPRWLSWAKEIQALSQAGITYTKDAYDKERYERLREISKEIMGEYTNMPIDKLTGLFTNETGYQTPKVDIRAVIVEQERILLVKEKSDGKWALPGGWGDVGFSPGEVAAKETLEEAGLKVTPVRMLAVYDTKNHNHPSMPYHVYKLFIYCERKDGRLSGGLETSKAAFFKKDRLPELSPARNTYEQVAQLIADTANPRTPCRFD
ncbi:NUDIX hydrolase [Sediminibacillus albus]|uniref:ADP-ribose pyrophosphatase YjhB, NUDIX family n=1 Tax=Sediminibacillus albus TaxID=407036 RepID=A0A1G8XH05_9BACI|nr:NUDIX hydrolase [Sediminibacillus albus]SDJ89696.1 ADP-ribose pyrophosphatase YjhB, NUDIX family [Sediminibacillus albus]